MVSLSLISAKRKNQESAFQKVKRVGGLSRLMVAALEDILDLLAQRFLLVVLSSRSAGGSRHARRGSRHAGRSSMLLLMSSHDAAHGRAPRCCSSGPPVSALAGLVVGAAGR